MLFCHDIAPPFFLFILTWGRTARAFEAFWREKDFISKAHKKGHYPKFKLYKVIINELSGAFNGFLNFSEIKARNSEKVDRLKALGYTYPEKRLMKRLYRH